MEKYLYILSFVVLFGVGNCQAAECNVAVVVVASIFGTLAVVLLVAGILGFLLWKRRKALLTPTSNSTPKVKNKKGDSTLLNDLSSPARDGHVNPAFNEAVGDLSTMEEGGLSDLDSPDRKKSPPIKENQKTWASLPGSNFSSPFNRQGSCGSLDDNYLNVDPEVTSVWLQSQDFIGLGFNISGNMRDGIMVSHVHNRGPAIESNKVKVGDKILNVTISFENIVYEDALTILSYASPYPVKVTLQKERVDSIDRKSNMPNEALNHPLYRSQSLDALQRAGKDSFKPKRTFSEMKPETRKDSSIRKELSNSFPENGELSQIKATNAKVENSSFKVSDVLVHKAEDSGLVNDGMVTIDLSGVGVDKQEVDISGVTTKVDDIAVDMTGQAKDQVDSFTVNMSEKASLEVNGLSKDASGQISNKIDDFGVPSKISNSVTQNINGHVIDAKDQAEEIVTHKLDLSVDNSEEKKSTQAVDFANLMDKMLDLNRSSDEPFNSMEVKNISNGPLVVEDSFNASISSEIQMSPPTKPTRKKKRSSTASNSSEEINLSQSDIKVDLEALGTNSKPVVEEVMTVTKVKDVTAAPPRSYEGESIVDEGSIVAEKKSRDISILSNTLELIEKEKDNNQEELPSPETLRKILLGSLDNVMIKKSAEPEGDPIEEEIIEAVKVNREECAPPLPKLKVSEEDGKPGKRVGINNNLNDIDDELIDEIIAMNSRPIESSGLPGRNTKENVGGVSYDIQVADLDKIENELKSENGNEIPKSPVGGKAFEIREDLEGNLVNVDLNKVQFSRTVSDAQLPQHNTSYEDLSIQILRAGSLKEDKNATKDFDLSNKHLLRSVNTEISEIPQDNSVKGWADQNKISAENVKELIPDNNKKVIVPLSEDFEFKKEEFIKENLDLTNMSDISSSQSPSSTRSASPITTTNGPPELSPLALKKALDFAPSENYSSSGRTGSYSFTLTNQDNDTEDAEC